MKITINTRTMFSQKNQKKAFDMVFKGTKTFTNELGRTAKIAKNSFNEHYGSSKKDNRIKELEKQVRQLKRK